MTRKPRFPSLVLASLLALVGCTPLAGPGPAAAPAKAYEPPGVPTSPATASRLSAIPHPAFVPPASPWLEREKKEFQKLIATDRVEVFVAPVQVQLYGFDRAARSLMTAQLAAALGAKHAVGNPFVIERALGDGMRRIDRAEIQRAARAMGAKRLLVTYAGHDGEGTMHVAMQPWDFDASTATWSAARVTQLSTKLGDDEAVSQAFQSRILPALLAAMGEDPKAARADSSPVASPASLLRDPVSRAFEFASRGPSAEALYFQLLGMLAPEGPERPRERFFEESLMALERVGAPWADAKLLRARALYYLHSRPAALTALGKPGNAQEEAFRQFLDGNLPELEKATGRITDPYFRAFSEMELRDLRFNYKVPVPDGYPAFVEASNEEWKPLLEKRLDERDPWRTHGNVELKAVLDRVMPIEGFDVVTVARGDIAMGRDVDEDRLGLLVFEHVRRVRDSGAFRNRCHPGKATCPLSAFLDLAEAAALSNVFYEINRVARLQGLYDAADGLITRYSKELAGQPEFEVSRARALAARQENEPRAPNSSPDPAAVAAAHSALYWEQGQSTTSLYALQVGSDPSTAYLQDEYQHDVPLRWYWADTFEPELRETIATLRAQLRESVWNLEAARVLQLYLSPEERAALVREIAGRFHGYPQRESAQAPWGEAPAPEDPVARFVAAEKERPDLWSNYKQHGDYLVHEKGAYHEAAEVYLRYPGFNGAAGYNPVGVSNDAYDPASLLNHRGDFEDARKLYRISAETETGSGGSLFSALRLHLLDRNYAAAAELSSRIAARYGNPYAIRDYLCWMFLFGYADDAWAAFDRFGLDLENPQATGAALVGKRLERRSDTELREWLLSERIRSAGSPQRFALIEAILMNTMDRKPWHDLADFMRKIEGRPIATFQGDERLPRAASVSVPASGTHVVLTPAGMRRKMPPYKNGDPVPSPMVFFADAYVPLREGKFALASDRFDAMAQVYPIEGDSGVEPLPTSYALPYYAWAAAKSGDKHGLESFLDGRSVDPGDEFEQHLAKAIFTGLRGERDASISHLERAFNYRPTSGRRPIFTEYEWAEICDWLFDATRDARYRDLALRMVRVNEEVYPFFAWAYAMEAKLLSPGPARTRALGIALHLDPGSERIAAISAREKAAARAWFEKHNPFTAGDKPGKKRTALLR